MKRISLVLALLPLSLNIHLTSSFAAPKAYLDVPSSNPNAPYIYELAEKNIIDGTSEGQFSPEDPLTREQFAKLLVTALGAEPKAGMTPFTDLSNDWSKPYITAAYEKKWIEGTSGSTFSPSEPLTRQAAASIIWRWLQVSAVVNETTGSVPGEFSLDADAWAEAAVRGVVTLGLRKEGKSSLAYNSKDVMTRGEAAGLIALSLRWAQDHPVQQAPAPAPTPAPTEGAASNTVKPTTPANVPSGTGESMEQSIYHPISGRSESKRSITWYRVDLIKNQSVLISTQNANNLEIRDAKGKFLSGQQRTSFIYEAEQSGTYYFVMNSDGGKASVFSTTTGTTSENPMDQKVWLELGSPYIKVPANETVYMKINLGPGATYTLEAECRTSEELKRFSVIDSTMKEVAGASGNGPVILKTTDSGSYLVKMDSGLKDAAYKLRLEESGVTKEQAVGVSSGYNEIAITRTGHTWVNVSLPRDMNYLLKVENAVLHDLELKGSDKTADRSVIGPRMIGEYDPYSAGHRFRLEGLAGSTAKVTLLDGTSPGAALPLIMNSDGKGKSDKATVYSMKEKDKKTLYKVQLEAGKTYNIFSNLASGSLDSGKFPEIVLLDEQQTALAQTNASALFSYKPQKSGVYYISFKPPVENSDVNFSNSQYYVNIFEIK